MTCGHLFLAALLCCFFFSINSATAGEPTGKEIPVIKIAYTRVIDDLPFFVGVEEGFFDHEGVHVELVTLTGTTNTLAAVMKDEIQGGIIGATQVFFAAKENIPIKVVAWLGKSHQGTVCGLHVRSSGNVRRVADLRGKRIVLSSDLSSRALISEALARSGIKLEEVVVDAGIGLDNPMQYEAVLKTGWVDVITV
jgi:NitT/TauT family transport system substrate-binding protein